MKKQIRSVGWALACLLAPASALSAASVNFVDPAKMSDVPRFERERESMQADLLAHFNKLAGELPAGQELKVEVLDIDLAGDVFPRVPVQDIRVYKDRGDAPRMHLRYRIEEGGKLVREGESRLVGMNYLGTYNRYGSESFAYEKRLLDDWFRKEVMGAK